MRSTILLWLLSIAAVTQLATAQGKVFLTTKEALELAFEDCKVERTKHVLDNTAKARIEQLAGHEPDRSMVFAYEARKDDKLVGTAYFDRHRVRSKQQLVMIVVDPQSRVRRIEVIAFEEPLDYLLRDSFHAQLVGRKLDAAMSTKREITPVTGSTLTVNATVAATRRILATHMVLFPEQAKTPKPKPAPKPARAPKRTSHAIE